MLRMIWLWAAAGVLFCASASRGEELPVAATEPTADQIVAWIDQFDRPEFTERQAASQQLEDAGTAALPQLEATAAAGSREASARALDILKRHFQSGADEVKPAAREALERLAQSTDPSTAQKARNVLNPPKEPGLTTPVGFQPGLPPPRINNFGGGFNGNFGGGINANFGAFRRISVSDINGRKVLEIDERERSIKMATAPGGGIEVEVTDKQNGRNRRLDAKDLDDLKRKDAELGRLYEQYHAPGQRQLGAIGPAALPFGFGPPIPARAAATPQEALRRPLESIDNLLELYKKRLPTDPAAQRMIDSLEQSKQRYKALLPELETTRVVR